ncbi:MAG: glutamine--fructose-6-phosphate transaminase (isomerizing) [Dehalococcoidales bacterium]|nr:glutamine--fructose-6-phosphate transaminase (isomerizing) [Dehalococcoidales bacterium]
MCGIVGYIGGRQAQTILLNCLGRLEYRGYDSCGIAVAAEHTTVFKDAVRVKALAQTLPKLEGKTGIGHTRWATHGEPSMINAHPHCDCTGRIAVAHNGVINNSQKLKQQLVSEGHLFVSETDSEVIPHLIEKYYEDSLPKAVEAALHEIEGSYAIVVLMEGERELVVARKDSPLIIGIGDRENFIASDVPAILDYTSRVMYLEEGDVAVVTGDEVKVRGNGVEVAREEHKVPWTVKDAQRGGYEHFMLKEIHEQPKVVRDTLSEYISIAQPAADMTVVGGSGMEDILMLACGTSYHAALVGKYIIEQLVKIPVRVEIASEFSYSGRASARNKAIVISQSGETADVLKAIKQLKNEDCHVIAVTNVVGSTVSRIADQVVYTRAGPEISVAATKSFVAQLIALYWLTLPYSRVDIRQLDEMVLGLRQLPGKIQQVFDNEEAIKSLAAEFARFNNAFFVGRGINYPIALEGALKLKEISYIHAEGYSAGELKHGPFALLGPETPVVAVVARDNTYEAMLANIKEVKARKSPVLALVEDDDDEVSGLADWIIPVPGVDALFSPVVNVVVLQLLAYYTAKQRGCPIDFPRNLAKSVTVE